MGRDRARQNGGPELPAAPSVSALLPRLVLEAARRAGVDPSRIARRVGLPLEGLDEPQRRVPLENERRLWPEVARAVGDEHFGLRLGTTHISGTLDVFEYLWRNAPTLGAALRCAAQYLPLLHDVAELTLVEEGPVAHLSYRFRQESAPLERHMVEYTFASILYSARRATGVDALSPLRVALQHAPPKQHHALTHTLSTEHVDFREPRSVMTFERSALALPLLHADLSLGEILRRQANTLLAERKRRSSSAQDQLVELLLCEERAAPPTLAALASRLHLGARTLQRRLASEGQRFSDVLERTREEAATQLLSQGITVADIASRLHYSDARAFRRAFIRWKGSAPDVYRRLTLRRGDAP